MYNPSCYSGFAMPLLQPQDGLKNDEYEVYFLFKAK